MWLADQGKTGVSIITERPIFITGLDRSGTSLLYALLGSHPNITMTRRTNFWHYFYQRFGDLADEENFEACLDTLNRYDRLQPLELDPDRIRREFWKGAPTYGRLLTLMLRPQAEKEGKSRWGDKSLRCEQYAGEIFKEFPEARVIRPAPTLEGGLIQPSLAGAIPAGILTATG